MKQKDEIGSNRRTPMTSELTSKYQHLRRLLGDLGKVAVAYSGGVDSTLLLKVAGEVLGERVLAVTADSATTPRQELAAALRLAREMGVEHLVVVTQELELPEFVKNPLNKCYICKKARFGVLVELARERGYAWVADGGNVDDQADFRPGLQAVAELGIRSPLAEAGLHKAEIRLLSRKLKLSTWNKPAYACLASRIPYHDEITVAKLRQIDAAEELIRSRWPAIQVRVRHYGDTARLEVEPGSIAKLAARSVRLDLVQTLKALGFKFVTLDLEGYRTGSLNPDAVQSRHPGGK